MPNQQTAEFSGMTMSLNTKYPAVGAPANIAAMTKPVATLNDTDFTLADLQSSYPNTAPAGSVYQGLYQARLKTAASTGSVRWQRADIKITGGTWTQVLPDPSADTTAPVAAITSGPASVTGSASATFAFGASDDTDTAVRLRLQCSLDGAAFAACTSPTTLTGLSSKRHTFAVRAVDRAGNTGTAVSRAWTVDRVAPTTTLGALPAVSLGSKVTVSARSADASSGVASRDFRVQKASYGGAFSAWSSPRGWGATKASSVSLTLSRGYQFCVSARSRDRVGNVSAWTAARCTASPLDERSLTASKGWTKVSGSKPVRPHGPAHHDGERRTDPHEGARQERGRRRHAVHGVRHGGRLLEGQACSSASA
ncbi:hypothetical protein GCM10025868_19380 [Angustibacter aerolatus]|uniref:Fibronectin type-III domain-containing protein n=1 Tax=Angustibacter aerolatus TaxID=1162965 RepID=A0ABQ6JH07_9ACTN|nr:hypothetical protein [Angustibacter aerolatus]GMA86688.1 hypothetical protein GCM10025868_19380 [Angustibacter aerolatus]